MVHVQVSSLVSKIFVIKKRKKRKCKNEFSRCMGKVLSLSFEFLQHQAGVWLSDNINL